MAVRTKEGRAALLFAGPNFLGFLLFVLGPVVASFLMAFTYFDPTRPPRFAGLQNFIDLLGFHMEGGRLRANDPHFWFYFYNTLFLMLGIPIGMVGSFLLAVMLSARTRGLVFYRTVYFLPHIASAVAVCVVWIFVLNTDRGLINSALGFFGLPGPRWLGSAAWAKPALILMGLWQGVGGVNMILYLAALQNIPDDLYESASIDGAGGWHKLVHITWPMVSPTTFFIFVISCIGGFQAGFQQAYLMTDGGPKGSTTTLAYYIFNMAYTDFRMGYAAAISWVLFLLVFALTILNWRFGGRAVHYD
ncbi:MAG: Lactose transport system permease protein LacF [Phycisphaerae bacterium]|nr:Lactose transport system permease protein LacF [Phycisphaerae bacterium]